MHRHVSGVAEVLRFFFKEGYVPTYDPSVLSDAALFYEKIEALQIGEVFETGPFQFYRDSLGQIHGVLPRFCATKGGSAL
jgi:hypothetical protein